MGNGGKINVHSFFLSINQVITQDHGGMEGEKKSYKQRGKEANDETLKYRERTEG